MTEPPSMSKWERLLPSTCIVLVGTGLLVAFAAFYEEPWESHRMLPSVSPATATVGAIVLANVAVRFLWYVGPLWPALNYICLMVVGQPRATSMFGAVFSHQKYAHLFFNMISLCIIGGRLHEDIGRASFMATYLGAGGCGFLATLAWYVMRNNLVVASLGASGAVFGLAGAYFWMHSEDLFKILNLPPDPLPGIPGQWWLALIAAFIVRGAFKDMHLPDPVIDHVSHFGGFVAGIAAGEVLKRKLAREKNERLEGQAKNMPTENAVKGQSEEKNRGRLADKDARHDAEEEPIRVGAMDLDWLKWWRKRDRDKEDR